VQFFQKAAPLDVSVLDPAFEFLNAVFHPLNRFTDFGIEGNGKAVLFLGGNPVVFVGVIALSIPSCRFRSRPLWILQS
jgi:hypothetical protein